MNFQRLVAVFSNLGIALVFCVSLAHTEGMKGKWGIGGFGAEAIPLGVEELRDRGDIGTDAGGTVRYGLAEQWAIGASYENIHLQNDIRREPLTLSAIFYHDPDNVNWTPVGEFGLGAASSDSGGPFTNFSLKAGISAEVFMTRKFALAPQLNFHYITATGKATFRSIVMSPGLMAIFYFGGSDKAAPQAQASPAAAAAAAVGVSLSPAQVPLEAGQSQAFQANISDAVRWTITPNLGTITETGLYQAPATVSFAQQVRVTATSMADASKSASGIVQLKPPATAPQEVSIKLEILFDTGKSEIKPAYGDELKKLSDFLQSYPDTSAQIEGHSDNTGNAAFNKTLSQQRADSVKNALVSRMGIDASRLSAVGYGQEKPIADNQTAAGRAQNRRVVAVVKTTVQQ